MRILITNFWLNEFNESENFCFEFVNHCTSLGHDVEIYALDIDAAMRTYCVENKITLHDSNSKFSSTHYDLIWMHHNVVPRDFLLDSKTALTANAVISHHMSAFEPVDIPFFPEIESQIANRILASSYDVKILLTELGLNDDAIEVIGSPAPKVFIGYESPMPQLNKFLFVSNDPPKNMLAAAEMLETIGFEVKRIERNEFIGNRNWISPEDFRWADAIISIEETIPYAVLSHRPIYLYNKYSGLGWVTDDSELNGSFLREQKLNVEVKTLNVSAIVEQLLSGFEDARNYINNLDQNESKKFQFEPVLDQILGKISISKDSTSNCFEKVSDGQKVSWLAIQDVFIREIHERKFAQASAKQALLERLIVLEKLEKAESDLKGFQESNVIGENHDTVSTLAGQKRFSISGLIQK